jgi:hypothetical protein
MILRKLFMPACFVVALTFACANPSTNVAAEESVGFDANAKPASCCAEKTECTEAKKAECAAKKAECETKQSTCPKSGANADG